LINAPARGGRSETGKDVVLAEGQPFKLGDLTITPIEIPGHTPGFARFHFPVKDKGQTRTAGLFGGTVLTTGILTTDALKQYTSPSRTTSMRRRR
jgi:metallo-beta-lactamase class B